MRKLILILITASLMSCKDDQPKTAQQIIDKTIETSRVNLLLNSELSFDFRDYHYKAKRNDGQFVLERMKKDSIEFINDILSNDGFNRFIDQELINIPDSMALKYSESVNSVHYFSVLPLGLNDAAVNKKRLEDISIKGKEYYKIEITFDQEGGGVDFEDVFVYWIQKETFSIDYMAYLFHVNGGGVRFREVSKQHLIKGIRLANYNNYKPLDPKIDVRLTDQAFINGQLKKVSEINLENIKIILGTI